MNNVITPKKMPINRQVITFLSNVASGRDNPTTAIIKANAVPIGIPLLTNTSITGTIPAALAYIGTASNTDKGTANQLSFDIYYSKNPSGTNPCIKAPIAIPMSMYSNTPLTMPHASFMITGKRFINGVRSASHSPASALAFC